MAITLTPEQLENVMGIIGRGVQQVRTGDNSVTYAVSDLISMLKDATVVVETPAAVGASMRSYATFSRE